MNYRESESRIQSRMLAFVLVTGLMVVGFSSGCQNGEKITKTKGIVMIDGNPSPAGTIEFYPVSGGRTANGVIQDDGTFAVSYRTPNDGLPPGEYKVAVIVVKEKNGGKRKKESAEGQDDAEFAPATRGSTLKYIVPQVYNSIQQTPLRTTIADEGEQYVTIKISTK